MRLQLKEGSPLRSSTPTAGVGYKHGSRYRIPSSSLTAVLASLATKIAGKFQRSGRHPKRGAVEASRLDVAGFQRDSFHTVAIATVATCLWIDGSKRAIRHARGVVDQSKTNGSTGTKIALLPLIRKSFPVQLPLARIQGGTVPTCIRPGGKLPLG